MQTLILGEGNQRELCLSFTQLPSLHEGNSAEPCLPGAALVALLSLRCLSEVQFFFFVLSKYRAAENAVLC